MSYKVGQNNMGRPKILLITRFVNKHVNMGYGILNQIKAVNSAVEVKINLYTLYCVVI